MTTPDTVAVTLDLDDAMIVGATLRMLARVNRSPDPNVGAQLERVGNQMTSAAKVAQVLAVANAGEIQEPVGTERKRGAKGVL